jgi:hypothetical protein
MLSKKKSRYQIWILGVVLAVSIGVGLTAGSSMAGGWPPEGQCWNDFLFTREFFLDQCGGFSTTGVNPFFILEPGYQLVLESDEEKAVITVLDETYTVASGETTRVVEERAFEIDEEEEVLVEISRNWFAICNRTNDVNYFGEFSQDCDSEERGGFMPGNDDLCADGEAPDTGGSWESGENDAEPGLIMPGTFQLGARYFQEMAPEDEAVDRGENVWMGFSLDIEGFPTFENCVLIIDTNPSEGICGRRDGDPKIYCPGVGLVMDEDLELVEINVAP